MTKKARKEADKQDPERSLKRLEVVLDFTEAVASGSDPAS
jgi:hypothetical protein